MRKENIAWARAVTSSERGEIARSLCKHAAWASDFSESDTLELLNQDILPLAIEAGLSTKNPVKIYVLYSYLDGCPNASCVEARCAGEAHSKEVAGKG